LEERRDLHARSFFLENSNRFWEEVYDLHR
jgi:hypothetical protein